MKAAILFFALLLLVGCNSSEQALIGQWKESEQRFGGNKGEKLSVEKIANGKVYTFKDENKLELLADGEKYVGVYELVKNGQDEILHTITSDTKSNRVFDQYFRIKIADSATVKKLSFIPVHPENELMYSFGRENIYIKK
ncbi:hypothetical protein [Flavobacterium sp.]|uniref:hypothetical protein n=1 Tax=Flavobacterium sp. TaxID=239 RepID=UPI00120472D4|nr:hypothetical protein [Flavobacterium sp.]RZJ72032.1 MAG: hypothetical protein EOO49_08375 [Flavobacterium sp.]